MLKGGCWEEWHCSVWSGWMRRGARSWKTSPAGRLGGEKQTGEDGETDSRQPHRQQVQCIVKQRALGRMVRLRRMKEGEESKVVE